jgi:hypothetical protein
VGYDTPAKPTPDRLPVVVRDAAVTVLYPALDKTLPGTDRAVTVRARTGIVARDGR